MGIIALREKDYKLAESYLQRAVHNAPDFETAHYYQGLTLAKLGRPKESADELALATALASKANKIQHLRLAPQ
jgi:tetratricopeptide (TPR) repeat protein